MYDIIIIGGGISGLYCALKLSKKYKLLLLDERNYLGGRIHTHKHPQYEIGAARYHNKHKHLCNLINKYKLSKYPISKNIDYLDINFGYISYAKNFFNKAISDILQKSSKLNKLYLQSITFKTLCEKYYNKDDVKLLINIFGYKTEFINLNAYDACRTFSNDFGNNQYYVIGEGMQSLCNKMVNTIINNNGTILKNKIVTNVLLQDTDTYLVKTDFQTYLSKKIIFAIKPNGTVVVT
jgi:protoporphyrinogen oxidase